MKKSHSALWSANVDLKKNSQLKKFCNQLERKRFIKNKYDFKNLWKWSIKNNEKFWSEVWDFTKIKGIKKGSIIKKNRIFYKNIFFPKSKLNYAENLLKKRSSDIAIKFLSESLLEKKISWCDLNDKVCKFSFYLKKINLRKGDRVAAYVPNSIESVITFLASSKNGLVWSSCSPDFGSDGVIDRFSQIKPKVLITCDYYYYNGKKINILEKIPEVLKKIKSIKEVIVFPYGNGFNSKLSSGFKDFNLILKKSKIDKSFKKFSFNHPLYILYSSGTTGVPKCITHGAGNVLIEHNKEFSLHCNVRNNDKVFYYTTTGWMMWNWLVGALSSGASIFLYDGSPTYPKKNILIEFCAKERITLFGVSAKYIDFLKKEKFNFSIGKCIFKSLCG